MATVIYNCKRCKIGKRVEYPFGSTGNGAHRIDSNGNHIPACVYIQAIGGGRPTVYGGDVEMAFLRPEHKCDPRCTGARGHNCECSCGGVNHGKSFAA